MTREEARQNLIALGINEPTDAQVTNYLNQFHSNRPQPEPAPVPQPQPTPEPKPEPKPTIDNGDDLEALRNQIAQLQQENIQKDIRAYAAEKGLKGDQAAKILASFKDNFEVAKSAIDSVSEIITESNKTAVSEYEKNILKNGTPNPGGTPGGTEKTTAEKIAESMFSSKKQDNSIISHYVGGN